MEGYRTRAIPDATDPASFVASARAGKVDEPRVLRAEVSRWPATQRWNDDYLLAACGDRKVRPSMALPEHGVPYVHGGDDARVLMTLREFWTQHLAPGERCYLDQLPLWWLEELRADVPIEELSGGEHSDLNLWIGRGTKSGLHFDSADNFLVMIRGHKQAVLAAPSEARKLYPFADNTSKSQIDAGAADFVRFPASADALLWTAELCPGDVLFIPIRWWHYLASPMDEISISLNCWFGRTETVAHMVRYVAGLGPRYAGRALVDFCIHGVLGRPHRARLYSPPPDGLVIYQELRDRIRKKLGVGGES